MRRILTPIGRCSKKLRRMLEIEEEQALAWRIKIPRRTLEEIEKRNRGGRWIIPANFAVPGAFWNRPVSPEGHVSFHFRWTTVSRSTNGNSVVSDARGKRRDKESHPADHDEYIAREGAVMTIDPSEYDAYAARTGQIGALSPIRNVALMTNISHDPAIRASFWNAVHSTARKAGPDRLILEPSRASRNDWRALASAANAPSKIREIATKFAAGTLVRKVELAMTKGEAASTINLIKMSIPAADRKKGPIRFAKGRKGRTQYRLETEIPHGLSAAARVRLMTRLAKEVEATGAMYTLVIHEPDQHNDCRNFHFHLVAHDRPARLIKGLWDFTIASPVEGQSGRVNYKARQKKIEIPALKTDSNRGDFEAFLKQLRYKFSELCNEELRAAGFTRLYDPRTFAAMGIDRQPTKKLGTRAFPLEASGVATAIGCSNAEIIWSHELQSRVAKCQPDQQSRERAIEFISSAINQLPTSDPRRPAALAILESAEVAAKLLDLVEPELAEYDVTLAMARARPMKALDCCSRILNELEVGGGTPTDRRNRNRILRRRDNASAFLDAIAQLDRGNRQIIAAQMPVIDEARRSLNGALDYVGDLVVPAMQRIEVSANAAGASPVPNSAIASRAIPPKDVATLARETDTIDDGNAIIPRREPVSVAPTGQSDLAIIFDRIMNDRLIVLGPEHHDGKDYRVAGVSRAELQALRDPANIARAQAELARIAQKQVDEIRRAHLLYRSSGATEVTEYESDASQHTAASNSALRVLQSYRIHPLAARLMKWETPDREDAAAKPESIWRRVRRSMRSTLPQQELQFESHGEEESVGTALRTFDQASAVPTPRPSLSIDQAIEDYVDVIRTSPDVRFVTADGKLRVDPVSVPEWKYSIGAFEDHEAVKKAIEDRWEEDTREARAAERHRRQVEISRARRRAEILAAFAVGELTAHKNNDRWVIEGGDEDLRYFAAQWCDHPDIERALQESASLPRPNPSSTADRSKSTPSKISNSELTAPHHNLISSVGEANRGRRSRPPVAPADPTLAELEWFRDRNGRGQ